MKIDSIELIKNIKNICIKGTPQNEKERDYAKDIIDIYCQCANYLDELKEALKDEI